MRVLKMVLRVAWKMLKMVLRVAWVLVKVGAMMAAFAGLGFIWLVCALPCMIIECGDRAGWAKIESRENEMKEIFGRGSGIRIKYRDYSPEPWWK